MPAIAMMLPAFAMWIVLWVGGSFIEQGRMQLSQFFSFAMFVYELTFPTFIMGWVFALLQRGRAAMQRIDEVLDTAPSIADRGDAARLDRLRGEIEFRNLSFRYDAGREEALRGVSLHVPAGSVLGVVGPIGSGKSTLASLIPRLFDVPDGQLFLDGVDVNRIPLRTLRSHIAMVPQDAFLFSMSLAENVAYGLPEADPRAGARGCRARAARQGRRRAPRRLRHARRGARRDALGRTAPAHRARPRARAAARHPDPRRPPLERRHRDRGRDPQPARGVRRRPVIVISHRVASVRDADQVVVLDEGRIVERGDHEALMRTGVSTRVSPTIRNWKTSWNAREPHERRVPEEALGKAYDAHLMRRLWRYVAPYGWQVATTLAMVVPMFLLELAPA